MVTPSWINSFICWQNFAGGMTIDKLAKLVIGPVKSVDHCQQNLGMDGPPRMIINNVDLLRPISCEWQEWDEPLLWKSITILCKQGLSLQKSPWLFSHPTASKMTSFSNFPQPAIFRIFPISPTPNSTWYMGESCKCRYEIRITCQTYAINLEVWIGLGFPAN